MWSVADAREFREFDGHTVGGQSVVFFADGERLLTSSYDRTLRVWKVADGTEIKRLEGHKSFVWAAAISADGRRALSGSSGRTSIDGHWQAAETDRVRLWDIASGKTIAVLDGHTDWVRSVAFSKDSRRALTAASDGTIRLWVLRP
jgi:predicted NACHT family NTPase